MTDSTTFQLRAGVELYRLHTAADLSELTRIRHQLRESVALLDGSVDLPDFLNELELAIVETATNVIRHACQSEPARTLTHIVSVDDGLLTYEIVHDGIAFEGGDRDVPEEIEPAEGGMGLFIIAQCVDSISYSPSCDGLQAIVLTKSLNKGE
ncbi:MAG: ATP-binding protein [Planctomycetota bacterium]|nr:ATP-binding protein [Planctomycetota bacterium]MDA1249693.1 ATP-binding protein [Planctomycetota bacterium]